MRKACETHALPRSCNRILIRESEGSAFGLFAFREGMWVLLKGKFKGEIDEEVFSCFVELGICFKF